MSSNLTKGTNGPVGQLEESTDSKPVQCRFESDRGYKVWHDFCRILAWVVLCRRLIRIEHQNASVAQLEDGNRFRVYVVWVRIPPGVQILVGI